MAIVALYINLYSYSSKYISSDPPLFSDSATPAGHACMCVECACRAHVMNRGWYIDYAEPIIITYNPIFFYAS